jgi:small basic protein
VIGIVMYVVFVFINTMVTGETPGDFFYLFLFFSLLAMSSARMAVLGTLRGGKQNVFDWRWFLGVLFAASVVVGLSAFMGGVLGEQFAWVGYIFLGIFGLLSVHCLRY